MSLKETEYLYRETAIKERESINGWRGLGQDRECGMIRSKTFMLTKNCTPEKHSSERNRWRIKIAPPGGGRGGRWGVGRHHMIVTYRVEQWPQEGEARGRGGS